ncbi:MAG: heme A synthase [Leptothrix sp. (in: b-proteobacteria)]
MQADLINLSPLAQLAWVGLLFAAPTLGWLAWRQRGQSTARRLRALTALALFLTFDLVLFGAFTRLTDSGLGCPDWPGCYGHASPVGAQVPISEAQAAMPTGPVTHGKAWVEMVHRYLASSVGVLLVVLMVWSWLAARRDRSQGITPRWATVTFLWVCMQGAFGALTVTMKLYPAIVTLHLLGGIGLLALLAVQAQQHGHAQTQAGSSVAGWWPNQVALSPALRRGAWALLLLTVAQVSLGGWVSTNYAVLACTEFPTCQGSWWPEMDFASGYTWLRELGRSADGSYLPFAALTAIHVTHRLAAFGVFAALGLLSWRLWHAGAAARVYARWLIWLGVAQLVTGLSNVVLGWPLVAAVAHTGGAAALVAVLAALLASATDRVTGRVARRVSGDVSARTPFPAEAARSGAPDASPSTPRRKPSSSASVSLTRP